MANVLVPHSRKLTSLEDVRFQETEESLKYQWAKDHMNHPKSHVLQYQLKAAGDFAPTQAELEQFPARMLREDGANFGFLEGHQNFLHSQQGCSSLQPTIQDVVVDINCSQEILDLIVSFIYSSGISVSTDNAAELLRVGDYLTAYWLLEAVMTWLLESELPRSPSTVLEVGRDRPDLGLLGAAAMWICADCPHDNLAPVEDLVDWVAASVLEPDSEEGKLEDVVLQGMTQILSLRQVIRVFSRRPGAPQWGLAPKHIDQLKEAFPEARDVLDQHPGEEEGVGEGQAEGQGVGPPAPKRKRGEEGASTAGVATALQLWARMADMVLAARERSCGITWKLLVRHLEYRRDHPAPDGPPHRSPGMEVAPGRSFQICASVGAGGAMGIAVRPLLGTFWQDTDAFKLSCVRNQSPKECLVVDWFEAWVQGRFNRQQAQAKGSPDRLSRWLENEKNITSVAQEGASATEKVLAIRLETFPGREVFKSCVKGTRKIMASLQELVVGEDGDD